jgi:hypothetical protein
MGMGACVAALGADVESTSAVMAVGGDKVDVDD